MPGGKVHLDKGQKKAGEFTYAAAAGTTVEGTKQAYTGHCTGAGRRECDVPRGKVHLDKGKKKPASLRTLQRQEQRSRAQSRLTRATAREPAGGSVTCPGVKSTLIRAKKAGEFTYAAAAGTTVEGTKQAYTGHCTGAGRRECDVPRGKVHLDKGKKKPASSYKTHRRDQVNEQGHGKKSGPRRLPWHGGTLTASPPVAAAAPRLGGRRAWH